MKVDRHEYARGLFRFTRAVCLVVAFACAIVAQEDPQHIQQGLSGGSTVDPKAQELYTLLTLSTGCSGSLLRNNWVITAAHCVDNPDPKNKGQFIQIPENSVTVTANWSTDQVRTSARIITFRPNDVAIIRVDSPFTVGGSTRKFIRDIFRDGQFPYFGQLAAVPIFAFGRGIDQFARMVGSNAVPSSGDGLFRVGYFKTTSEDGTTYSYPSINGQHIAGGDSGGPSFATVRGTDTVLMGVHSLCSIRCLSGKICGDWPGPGNAPSGYSKWKWVTDTPECTDAAIAPVWDEINRYLGAFTPPEEATIENPEGPPISPIAPPGPTIVPAFIYGIDARGFLQWYRHDGAQSGIGFQTAGAWQGASVVGRGWGDVKRVFPGGGDIIYAITGDGTLKWYEHKAFNIGGGVRNPLNWGVTKNVGRGWDNFVDVFSAGDGVIYVIEPDGTLKWYRHLAYRTGEGLETPGAWATSRNVGRGWTDYRHVFSAGNGVIYVIAQDGTLRWYRHKAYLTGEGLETRGAWEGPKNVGRGWGEVQQVFSPGDGIIYAIMGDGTMRWYKHVGYLDGRGLESPGAWQGPKDVGRGWSELTNVFALLPSTQGAVR